MALFPWGQVIKEHSIGEYTIIEYHPHNAGTPKINYKEKNFSC